MVSTQARVSAAEPANVLEGSHRGLLNNILRVRTATGDPPGEPEGIDEVRQEHLGESGLIVSVVHIHAIRSLSPPSLAAFTA